MNEEAQQPDRVPAVPPAPAEGVPMTDERVLDFMRENGMTVEVPEAELRRLQAEITGVIAAAESVMDTVRQLAGPNPSPVPQHLITMMNMGAGYFRHSRDTLGKLFVARNAARREAGKKKGAK